MKIKNWYFLVKDTNSLNLENDNVDVSVTLEDGSNCVVVVSTVKNLDQQMHMESKRYLPSGCPQIIVATLETDVVNEALLDYARDDAYWLKLYHCAGIITTKTINSFLADSSSYCAEQCAKSIPPE